MSDVTESKNTYAGPECCISECRDTLTTSMVFEVQTVLDRCNHNLRLFYTFVCHFLDHVA